MHNDNAPALPQSNLSGLVRWLLLVTLTFGILALGMAWLARSVSVASPFASSEAAPASPAANTAGSPFPPPDFRLASLDGPQLGPPDYTGKVVVIDFWASWCAPCRQQAQFLDQLHEQYPADQVQFLAINMGEDETTVRNFVQKTPFPYPVLMDPQQTLSQPYEIYGLPTVMIVDRQGQVTYHHIGVSSASTLKRALTAAGA